MTGRRSWSTSLTRRSSPSRSLRPPVPFKAPRPSSRCSGADRLDYSASLAVRNAKQVLPKSRIIESVIRRVRIKNYKSLRDVDLRLQPLTVIIGPNAVGKSNLFDALGLLSRIATLDSLKDAFELHRGTPLESFTLPDGGLQTLLKEESAKFTMEVDLELSPSAIRAAERQISQLREGLPDSSPVPPKRRVTERFLRYRVTVEMKTRTGVLRVVDEKLEALTKDFRTRSGRRPFIEKMANNRIHLRMEGQAHPSYFDVGLDHSIVSKSLYPPHYPHITALREDMRRWRFFYLEPGLMREDQPLERADSLQASGANLAALFNSMKASQSRQFEASKRLLHSLVPYLTDMDVELSPDGFLRLVVQENGARFSSRVISEGTLRILGLIAILSSPGTTTVLGYEEPENGVHPRRLQLIAEMLLNSARDRDTQILINTHSPFLATFFPNADLVVCQRDERDTHFEPFPLEAPMLKKDEIAAALEEPPTPLYERIVRGDYGG
jgi:predicted ATPase